MYTGFQVTIHEGIDGVGAAGDDVDCYMVESASDQENPRRFRHGQGALIALS